MAEIPMSTHYNSCVRRALQTFLEEKRDESAKIVVSCPPMTTMMDSAQKVIDKAAEVTHKKKECRDIRKKVMGIHKSFRAIVTLKALKAALMGPVVESHVLISRANQVIDQHGGKREDGWVERKFQPKDKFEAKFDKLMKELGDCENALATAIKIVKDAVKTGEIMDSADEPAPGSALTEEAVKAFDLVTKSLPRRMLSVGQLQEAKDELDAAFPDAPSEVAPSDVAPSEAEEFSTMADMLAEERGGKGRKQVKDDTILGRAFIGDFWKVIEFWGGDDVGELDDPGRTYAPLHQAVFWESLEGVVLLTSRGADPNVLTVRECPTLKVAQDSTPLHLAATIGNAIIVKQLICDGANENLVDANGLKPYDVAGTAACRAVLEDASGIRERMARFAELIDDAESWDEALQYIQGAEGLPANVMLPPGDDCSLEDKYHPIQKATLQGNIAAYVKLVYSGALPIQSMDPDAEGSGPFAAPSSLCEDAGLKPLLEMIERMCREPPSARPATIPEETHAER